jgi:FkbM family methyltransferase
MFEDEYAIQSLQKIIPNGHHFEMLVTPRYVEHYVNNTYEPITTRIVSTNLSKGGIFIDIGAHYGFYTLLAGNLNKSSKILAFEPAPVNFQILKQNVELNNLQNVELFNLAVSDKNEVRKFKITEASDSCSFYEHPLASTIEQIDVKTATLDSILKGPIDAEVLIKIDAEGHEFNVLEGMENLLRNSLPKLKLIVEYNPNLLERADRKPGELVSRLFELGFQVFVIDEIEGVLNKIDPEQINDNYVELAPLTLTYNIVNLLCVPIEASLSVVFFSHSPHMFGAERCLLTYVTDLVKNGIECTVFLPSDGKLRTYLENVGAFIKIFPYDWWADKNNVTSEFRQDRINNSFKTVWNDLYPTLKKVNPDVIVTNTTVIPWGALSAFLLNKPHIWYVQEFGGADHEIKYFYPQQIISQYIEGSSNLVISNSKAITKYYFGESKKDNIQTIYLPVNYELVRELSTEECTYFKRKDSTRLALVGTIQAGKGQIDAINAVNELINTGKKVELLLAGGIDPEYYETIRELINQYNLQTFIHIIDFQDNPYPIFKNSDLILVCSRNEAFGLVTLEAMSLGKPVIGTNSGGTPEIIQDNDTGLLYTPGDYKELALKISELIDDPENRNRIGQKAALHAINDFSKEISVSQFLAALRSQKYSVNTSSREFIYWCIRIIKHQLHSQLIEEEKNRGNWDQIEKDLQNRLTEKENQITELREQLSVNTNHNAKLLAQLTEKDNQAKRIQQHVTDINDQLASLQNEIQEKENLIIALKQQLEERKTDATSLHKQLEDTKHLSADLYEQIGTLEQSKKSLAYRVSELEQENSTLDLQINNLEQDVISLKNYLQQREQILQDLNSKLLEIFSSTAWKIIQLMWKIRLWLVPKDSSREKYIKIILSRLRKKNQIPTNLSPSIQNPDETINEAKKKSVDATNSIVQPIQLNSPVLISEITKYRAIYDQLIMVSKDIVDPEYAEFSDPVIDNADIPVKLIAFYLPQYHPIPENDMHWGKGFTEWTNVTKAIPQFLGHYQPRLPGELGFYDLRIQKTLIRQMELAKHYGIYGFCFHYYWFSGKKILDSPLNRFISDPNINFPFCICWANENWTRRWDGREDEILIEQKHTVKNDKKFICDIEQLLRHENYIKIGDRPLILVYRANILENASKTAAIWREYCAKQGLGNPYLVAAQTFGFYDPISIGFDAAVEFPPHNIRNKNITNEVDIINSGFTGNVFSYSDMVEASIEIAYNSNYRVFKTVFPSWDNEPRKPSRGTIFTGSTPQLYKHWLLEACRRTFEYHLPEERFVFINAWNEWGEGAYLEPDRRFGYAYLKATADALTSLSIKKLGDRNEYK